MVTFFLLTDTSADFALPKIAESQKKVQVGKDQEKAQSENIPMPKPEVKKTKLTIRYMYRFVSLITYPCNVAK